MSVNKVIVVGEGMIDTAYTVTSQPDVLRAHSCLEVERLLEEDASVHLVCTDVRLPDGSWCDVLRLIVKSRMSGEVRVLGGDGRTILRLEVKPRHCSIQAREPAPHESWGAIDSALCS